MAPSLLGVTNNVITMANHFGEQKDSYDAVDLSVSMKLPRGVTLAGGTNRSASRVTSATRSTIRTLTPSTLTSIVLQSGRSLNDCDIRVPWQTQLKFYVVYPLPRYDIDLSAAFQSAPRRRDHGVLYGNQRPDRPIPRVAVSPPGPTRRQPCSSFRRARSLAIASTSSPDFRLTKRLKVLGTEVQGMFDLYNVLNANTVLAFNPTFGPAWLTPTKHDDRSAGQAWCADHGLAAFGPAKASARDSSLASLET